MNKKLNIPVLYNGRFTFLDEDGNFHKQFAFDHVREHSFSYGYCPFLNYGKLSSKERKYKWKEGYLHESGQITSIIGYEHLSPFRHGLSRVRKDNLYGYLNTNLEEFITCEFVDAGQFSEGLAYVSKDSKYGYIDEKGETVLDFKYNIANDFSCDRAYVETDNDKCFINKKGEHVFSLEHGIYTSNFFRDGLIKTWDDSLQFGFLDTNGEIVVNMIYKDAIDFSEGLAAVRVEDKWGVINTQGDMVIHPKYFFISSFCKGVAIVCIQRNKKLYWGCIDRNGKEIIPIEFNKCESYSGEYILASIDDEYFYFNNKGESFFKQERNKLNKYLSFFKKLNIR